MFSRRQGILDAAKEVWGGAPKVPLVVRLQVPPLLSLPLAPVFFGASTCELRPGNFDGFLSTFIDGHPPESHCASLEFVSLKTLPYGSIVEGSIELMETSIVLLALRTCFECSRIFWRILLGRDGCAGMVDSAQSCSRVHAG